jgi:5-(carboxyamino)imidazole ribonucleotide synthase
MRIGIIGAGQLGQMLGYAARDLGYECRFIDPSESPPAATVGQVIRAPFDDADALAMLALESDVITYEFENVPVDALAPIADIVPVYPPPGALRHAQDRLAEKRLFGHLEIPLPDYRIIDSRDDLAAAVAEIGLPLVLKTRRLGYDGKGQFVLRQRGDVSAAWESLGGKALIAEQWIPFDREVSAIGARNVDGDLAVYPLTHNEHAGGILHTSRAPFEDPGLESGARQYLGDLMDHLGYVGVLALELFVAGDKLLANEFAPRVHNSGHWTIEGARTSQFSNHLLAITNQPLGPTSCQGHAGMVNLIGEIPAAARHLTFDGCRLHDYGKSPRPGRKLGHITVVAETAESRDRALESVLESLSGVSEMTMTSGQGFELATCPISNTSN